MKTIILCGGMGTRMKEETEFKPKPLVKVGEHPILWHIMKIYAHAGFNEFIIALGYKGKMIREYFAENSRDEFKVTFIDTGVESETGKRILEARSEITDDGFMVTYGDGVANIDIKKLVNFHKKQGTLGTITGVQPQSKYGLIKIDEQTSLATEFKQKPVLSDYVSGGFMIFAKEVLTYFDEGPMENAFPKLIELKELSIYKHENFWKAMDTYREVEELNQLWNETRPWAIWE